jgi:hypothetical protein
VGAARATGWAEAGAICGDPISTGAFLQPLCGQGDRPRDGAPIDEDRTRDAGKLPIGKVSIEDLKRRLAVGLHPIVSRRTFPN